MPAGLPGATLAQNQGNPTQGRTVLLDPLSGPTGSPLDAKMPVYDAVWGTPEAPVNDPENISTGGLSTGIGITPLPIGLTERHDTAPEAILAAGFNDNQIPGSAPTFAAPPPIGVVTTNTIDSNRMYIGGGRMVENPDPDDLDQRGRPFVPDPYSAGVALCAAGQGGARDGGAGPAFTGFPMAMVTAAGAVAAGAAIETGFYNRSGGAMTTGQSTFGVGTTELAAAS